MQITRLQCDYMDCPLGFDFHRPALNWVTETEGLDKRQSAFQLQVSRDPAFENILYDTGKVLSDQSVGFRLPLALASCTRYHWRVKVYDESGRESPFSKPAWFETGRYDKPWQAKWIGFDRDFPQLRKGFQVAKPVRRARAYASGVGLYRLFINGEPASDELLTPGFNAYDLWIQYQTYDLTDKLVQGQNVIGSWLGNGYYKGRVNWPGIPERRCIYGDKLGLILELDIEYADGTRDLILTDESWEAMTGPYLRTEIYDGEVFDARLYDEDWCKTCGNGKKAQTVDIDKSLLQARRSIPVKAMHALPAIEKILTPAGEQVFDFGQNIAGILEVKIDAPKDTRILFQFGEALTAQGNFYRENMRTALAEAIYISDGKARIYTERFTFHGFRYVKVTGYELPLESVTAHAIYSAMATTGSFQCSEERVNQLFRNALWSQRDNFVDVPTDCPQRDERMGWTGDAQVFCPTACMNMDSNAFFRKYLYDLKLEQGVSGYVPVVIPNFIRDSGIWGFTTTGWADAAVLIPWYLYLYYGDKVVLEDQYDSMKACVDYMREQDVEGVDLYQGFHLGDWLAQDTKDPDNLFGLTPTTLVATAYYAWSAELLSRVAGLLDKSGDETFYADLARRVRSAFRKEFVSENGRVSSETQTAYILALNMDMLLPRQREKAADCLAERLEIDRFKLTTGFLGTPYLCPVLSECGLNEYAYRLLMQSECPSWLYEVDMGATTIWERWNSVRPDGSFGPVSMNSLNHYAFGAVCEWLYRYVAGINPDPMQPGYKHVIIRPRVHDTLGFARASIQTVHGKVESAWALDGSELTLTIRIPFNAAAEIWLPDAEGQTILLDGAPAQPQDIREGCAIFRCGSGQRSFRYTVSGDTVHKEIVEKVDPLF